MNFKMGLTGKVTALFVGVATLSGCAEGVAIATGYATKELAEAAGADSGTAKGLGVAAGLGVYGHLKDKEAEQGSCVWESVSVRGSNGSGWEEKRVCRRQTSGYTSGPQ